MKTSLKENVLVHADRDRIEQVLVNLISNALKYAPDVPLEVIVEIENKQACLRVKDYGPGISDEEQLHIFERFARAVASRNISGLGLGLYISQQIVQAHGGALPSTSLKTKKCS